MLEEIKPHIAELRSRLIKIVVTFFILFILAFVVWKDIFLWIAKPAFEAMKDTSSSEMIFTNLVEPFMTAIRISLYTAFFASLPVLLYHTWKFIAPGLYDHEKKLVIPFVLFGTIMFIVGAAFAYYIVFPIGFKVMINFGGKDFVAMLKISEYVSVALKIMIGFGIAFELPVVTYFLAKLGLVTDKTLKEFARYAIVIIFIVAAVLTPPDLFSQMAMAAPLLLLYGLSILIAKVVNPEKEETE
ncbi:twin arginine-targeting protein translocase TatC [Nautilia profundicola AmH]|uniref:Sec-independent protein translocase protein TatC n=1 Tax=Nautilia profundicola (strain ATCC BAA-1463 / DSM 18972 / AmH) TaxID=598659 RepID=B9LA52_NAUPA|nr:twin-arginine translocase subunit TatC [Nautilia profundicola]ACM93104.1 twin arginine-targeting protein translocase TatC [Nautilia profundicola AmH]